MKVLVILDRYVPFPQANGICINNILSSFDNLEEAVIVCRVDDTSCLQSIKKDNTKWSVYSVCSEREKSYSQCNMLEKVLYCMRHFCRALFGKIFDTKLATKYIHTCSSVIKEKKIDIVISVLQPTAAVEAGSFLKRRNPHLKFVIYDLDTAINSDVGKIEKLFIKHYQKKIVNWEKKVYSNADVIVHLESHKGLFLTSVYEEFVDKTVFQQIPLLRKPEESLPYPKISKDSRLRCVYAGAFYPKMREPQILFDVFTMLDGIDFCFDVYTSDNYQKELNKKYQQDTRFKFHSLVSEDEISVKMQNSNVLISLGNKDSKMFPSKIVSYIAAMRPIIHFYQWDEDPVKSYLLDYEYALLIDTKKDNLQNSKMIQKFLVMCSKELLIDWEDVSTRYYRNTPEYNARELAELLKM